MLNKEKAMSFTEPRESIDKYPQKHSSALLNELSKELSISHPLYQKAINLVAKREDRDDILLKIKENYYIVHLTWKGGEENFPYPLTEHYSDFKKLNSKLKKDSEEY